MCVQMSGLDSILGLKGGQLEGANGAQAFKYELLNVNVPLCSGTSSKCPNIQTLEYIRK